MPTGELYDKRGPGLHLTAKEGAVLRALAEHGIDKVIADRLGITENTVRCHLARLRRKTGTKCKATLVWAAVRKGWLKHD